MNRPKVLIIGCGVVGNHILKEFPFADRHDPYKDIYDYNSSISYDYAFVCVPTEMLKDGSADISVVRKSIMENNADLFIVKSTMPPGSTDDIIKKTGKSIIFSPEYAGATQHVLDVPEFVILGGSKELTNKAAQLYMKVKNASFKIMQTDAKTAELTKYMINSYLAMKVVFCNEFYRIAKEFNINYPELRELFTLDPRVDPSHTFVYDDAPYYDSHCFNKDLPAIIEHCKKYGYYPEFIDLIVHRNNEFKEE